MAAGGPCTVAIRVLSALDQAEAFGIFFLHAGHGRRARLIGVGIHRYHLAEVLATHIVRDVATDREFAWNAIWTTPHAIRRWMHPAQASADDQKLKEFFEQVAPILSQHRGINAKSRVMMNAVAEQLGLTETELEQALATLQRLAADPNENDPRQLERRESFRTYLRRAMAQLPHGIITFKTETRCVEAGEHFHGVAPQWIKPTINEVASEIGARFISKQQAIEHVPELVEDFLGDKPVIDNARHEHGSTPKELGGDSTRWMSSRSCANEPEALRRQLAAKRRRARWVLNLVVAGSVIAIARLWRWMLLLDRRTVRGTAWATRSQAQKNT